VTFPASLRRLITGPDAPHPHSPPALRISVSNSRLQCTGYLLAKLTELNRADLLGNLDHWLCHATILRAANRHHKPESDRPALPQGCLATRRNGLGQRYNQAPRVEYAFLLWWQPSAP
jgi:hypothetical protein